MNRLYGLTTRDKDAVQRLLRSAQRQTEPHRYRRNPRLLGGADIRIFKVQSEAAGDGVYNCYEQTLNATEWTDTAGDPKFDDKNTTSVEVLNLAEFDPEAEYTAALSAGDMLAAWQMTDDEGTKRWVGMPCGDFGTKKYFATIVDTISKGDVIDGTDPKTKYYVKMKDEAVDAWVSSETSYAEGDLVRYDGRIWECTKDHESHISRPPASDSAFWKAWGEMAMTVLHFKEENLPDAIPYYQIGNIVEVCQYENVWYILGTVINYVKGTKYSLMWDEEDGRAKAVFA